MITIHHQRPEENIQQQQGPHVNPPDEVPPPHNIPTPLCRFETDPQGADTSTRFHMQRLRAIDQEILCNPFALLDHIHLLHYIGGNDTI